MEPPVLCPKRRGLINKAVGLLWVLYKQWTQACNVGEDVGLTVFSVPVSVAALLVNAAHVLLSWKIHYFIRICFGTFVFLYLQCFGYCSVFHLMEVVTRLPLSATVLLSVYIFRCFSHMEIVSYYLFMNNVLKCLASQCLSKWANIPGSQATHSTVNWI